ncbi:MAG TPA: hypothetical protein VL361_02605 [Candidatus Limnocylindrales bacterium]|nr:hypothetical protein [Candidatus Limnocylindrales bacterium]
MKTVAAPQLARLFTLACLAPSCLGLAAPPPTAHSSPTSAELCDRTSRIFLQADLFKPGREMPADLDSDLAPLIIQEVVSATTPSPGLAGFGSLRLCTNTLTIDLTVPAVYLIADTVDLNGRPHRQLTFIWFYSLQSACPTNQALPLQGLRMTLDSSGRPALWEVLADASRLDLLFVSRGLEIAAREKFGRPWPGRHFSIERSINETPGVVVAGVLEDSPVPMGPIVYLSSETHAVSTVTCRCMPAQAKTLRQTSTYQVIDASNDQLQSLLSLAKARLQARVRFWPEKGCADNRLERALRLPASF